MHLNNLKSKLEDRNYPQDLIENKFEKAKSEDRKELIFQSRKKALKDGKVRLMFTHNTANPPIHQWVRAGKKAAPQKLPSQGNWKKDSDWNKTTKKFATNCWWLQRQKGVPQCSSGCRVLKV